MESEAQLEAHVRAFSLFSDVDRRRHTRSSCEISLLWLLIGAGPRMRRKWFQPAAGSSQLTAGLRSFGLWCASPATRPQTAMNVVGKRVIGYLPEDRWTHHAN